MAAITNFLGDVKVLVAAARAKAKPPEKTDIASFSLLVENNAAAIPSEIALICEDETETWQGLNERDGLWIPQSG